jgi:periplasmic protein TonB
MDPNQTFGRRKRPSVRADATRFDAETWGGEQVSAGGLLKLSAIEESDARKRAALTVLCVIAVAVSHFFVAKVLEQQKDQSERPNPIPVVVTLSKPKPPPPPPPPPEKKVEPVKVPPMKPQVKKAAVHPPKPTPPKPAPTPKPVEQPTPKPAPEPTPDAVKVPSETPVSPAPAPKAPAVSAADQKVSAPDGYADYLNNPAPAYPAAARRLGYEGHALLKVHVLASGHADQVDILQSSGYDMLDKAAVAGVKQWVFVPAKRGQTPIDGWVNVPMDFKLGG